MALNDVPKSAQTLNGTRDQIRNNFLSIASAVSGFSLDHFNFGDTNGGKHKAIHMINQTGVPTTGLGEIGFYALNGTTSTVPELWVRKQSNANPYSITEYNNEASFSAGAGETTGGINKGWTRLPNGLLELWGGMTVSGGNNFVTVFANNNPGWPGFAAVPFNVIITPFAAGGSQGASFVYLSNLQQTQMTISTVQDATLVYYRVIGVSM